jgi:hypothetical protein
MSDGEWQTFVAKTRPPAIDFADPADRMRAHSAAIAAKMQQNRQRDNTPQPPRDPADLAALVAQIQAAEASGDHTLAIALKQQLRPKCDPNGNPITEKGRASQ